MLDNDDDGVGSSRKKHFSMLSTGMVFICLTYIYDILIKSNIVFYQNLLENEFSSINISDGEENAKQKPRKEKGIYDFFNRCLNLTYLT